MARQRRPKPPTQVLTSTPGATQVLQAQGLLLTANALSLDDEGKRILRTKLIDSGMGIHDADKELAEYEQYIEAIKADPELAEIALSPSKLRSLKQLLRYLRPDDTVVIRRARKDGAFRRKLLDIAEEAQRGDHSQRVKDLITACDVFFGPNGAMMQGKAAKTFAKETISSAPLTRKQFGAPTCPETITNILREYYHLHLDAEGVARCAKAGRTFRKLTEKERKGAIGRWRRETAP